MVSVMTTADWEEFEDVLRLCPLEESEEEPWEDVPGDADDRVERVRESSPVIRSGCETAGCFFNGRLELGSKWSSWEIGDDPKGLSSKICPLPGDS